MATKQTPAQTALTEVAPGASKTSAKKLIIIGAALAIMTLIGGGTAWLLLKPAGDAAEQQASKPPPVFVDLDAVTVNLAPDEDGFERYMQLTAALEVADAKSAETVKAAMPAIRSEIILDLAGRKHADINSRQGKEDLAEAIAAAANGALIRVSGAASVQKVNFTHIIVQ